MSQRTSGKKNLFVCLSLLYSQVLTFASPKEKNRSLVYNYNRNTPSCFQQEDAYGEKTRFSKRNLSKQNREKTQQTYSSEKVGAYLGYYQALWSKNGQDVQSFIERLRKKISGYQWFPLSASWKKSTLSAVR